jgi:hypothetical protein
MHATLLALALAQAPTWVPTAPERRVHDSTNTNQAWTRVAIAPNGDLWVAFSASTDTYVRGFDPAWQPLIPTTRCNTNTLLQQDECEISVCPATGNVFVAWSDRSSSYTEYMNVARCVLSPAGQFIRTEFSLSDLAGPLWYESKWRPLLHPLREGGWAAVWTMNYDEEVALRVFDPAGQPLTPDIQVNPAGDGNRQDYPDVAEGRDGNLIVVYLTGATPTPDDVLVRMMAPLGAAPLTQPALATTLAGSGYNEREPRVASNARGGFVAVWQGYDGSGRGVWLRRFNEQGRAFGGQKRVNQNTASDQRDPQIEMDALGNALIVWSDDQANQIKARYYDPYAQPYGGEFVVNSLALGTPPTGVQGRRTPSVALSADGARAVFGWSGESQVANGGLDAYVREFVLVP